MTIFPKKIQKVSINIRSFTFISLLKSLGYTPHHTKLLSPFIVFNVVPWLSTIPGIVAGGLLTKRLQSDGYTVSHTRKIVESVCMITEAVCLLLIGNECNFDSLQIERNDRLLSIL